MLLVATIPLAFALTYSSPQVGNIDNKASENDGLSSDNVNGDKVFFKL